MSGLVCQLSDRVVELNDFKNEISATFLGRQYHTNVLSEGSLNISLVSTPNSAASMANDLERKITVFVDGYFIETLGSEESSAEWFLRQYGELGEDCISSLNGSFNILIVEREPHRITVITDRYGTRPLFYSSTTETFSLAYKADLVASLSQMKVMLNRNMVANMLSHSRIWYSEETFYEEVISFPAGVIAKWCAGDELNINKYSVKKLYRNSIASIEGLAKVFKEVIADFNKVSNVGMSLSGGLDSRLLLASGFKGPTFTWGYQEQNDEIELAKICAAITDNDWHFLALNPSSFLDKSNLGDKVREGLDLSVQAYTLDCYPHVVQNGVDGLITGLALDFTMGGSYTPEKTTNISIDQVLKFAFSKIEYFSAEEREALIQSEDIKKRIDCINDSIINSIKEESDKSSAIESLQRFFTEHRIRRCMFQRQMWQRIYCEDYIPTFDNRIVDYLDNFTLEARANHKVLRDLLISLSPELAEVPYQGTNLPAIVPTEYWAEGTAIEARKENLARRIFHETKGKVFIPYNRYYSNFDEWMRTNNDWQEDVRELLLSDNAKLAMFVNQEAIEKLVKEQETGKSTHYGKIIILMSLEKTLRSFYK